MTRGSATQALGDFTLLARDGSVTRAVEACSSGFVQAARERTVVFSAAQPGRLAYGPDPDRPVAMWHLAWPLKPSRYAGSQRHRPRPVRKVEAAGHERW
jgi:hypothetical protein